MVRLEIIHVRLAAEYPEGLTDSIRHAADALENDWCVQVYERLGPMADLGIHIKHRLSEHDVRPSSLGEHLASELRQYGMVEHSIWCEYSVELS
jgi:hypothetical protein